MSATTYTKQQLMIIRKKTSEEAKAVREAERAEKKAAKEAAKAEKLAAKEAAKAAKAEAKAAAKAAPVFAEAAEEPPMNTQPPAEMDERETSLFELAKEIYVALGAGHTESVYHGAMKVGLHDLGLKFETERDLPVTFRGRYVGTVRADLVVDNSLVIELKITGKIEDAEDQCRQYMKLTGIQRGLVVLFPKRDESAIVFKCVRL
jgi:GxxExxY protein